MPEGYLEGKLLTAEDMSCKVSDRRDRGPEAQLQHHAASQPPLSQGGGGPGADLVLSGHFHGGTIRLPGLGGLHDTTAPVPGEGMRREFSHGRTRMIVNRGLGTHSIKLRLNDRPEISVIDVLPKETERRIRSAFDGRDQIQA